MTEVEDIQGRLRKLSARELAKIQTYMRGLEQFSGRSSRASGGLVLEAFKAFVERHALGYMSDVAFAAVNKYAPMLEDYLARGCPNAQRITRRAILDTALAELRKQLQAERLVVNPALLAEQLGRIPAVMDRSFPGYAELRILAEIVKG